MKKDYSPEKILIIIALVLFSGIIFYNAFFFPEVSTPSIIYVDRDPSADSQDEQTENSTGNGNSSGFLSNSEKININTASAAELADKLPRVGEVIAKRIVEYREYNGKFNSIEEIKNVSGIGDKTFENFKDLICV